MGVAFRMRWARPRMWEQYGENHPGACLVFWKEALVEQLRSELNRIAPYYHREVAYTPDGFSGSHARHLGPEIFPDDQPFYRSAAEYLETHHEDLFFLKTADWATEFEYRFAVLGNKETPEHLALAYGDALAAVVVGEHFPDWQSAGAREQCERAGAEFRRLNWAMGRPFPSAGGPSGYDRR